MRLGRTDFTRIFAACLLLTAACGDDEGGSSSNPGAGGSGSGGGSSTVCNPDDTCSEAGDFQIGGTVEVDGNPEMQVALQTVADVAGIASASVDQLTSTCRAIAEDLGAPSPDRAAAAAQDDKRERLIAWCTLAANAIVAVRGSASLIIDIQPPSCTTSAIAKSECQGRCADEECDATSSPPDCEGGKMDVACMGSCTGVSGSSVSCIGSCSGECQGACTAEGGVACAGRCDGTCQASAEGGGSGIQADGICNGTCQGTCEVTAPGSLCDGSCDGSCSASCQATAGAASICDGQCDGSVEPLHCEGGELRGGCETDQTCEDFCNADVAAKAQCSPARVDVEVIGSIDANAAGLLKVVLERTLPQVADFKARSELLASASAPLGSLEEEDIEDVKGACVAVVVAAAQNAEANVQAVLEASVGLFGAIGS